MKKKTIIPLAAIIIFIIVILGINLAIKKYETQPITIPGSSVSPEQKPGRQPESAPSPSVSVPAENKAAGPSEDVETEPPIPSTEPLLR